MVKKIFSTDVVKLFLTMLSSIILLISFGALADHVSANTVAKNEASMANSFSVVPSITLNQQFQLKKVKNNPETKDPDKITYHEFNKNITDKPRIINKKSHHNIVSWLEFLIITVLIIGCLIFTFLKIRKEYHQHRYTKKDPAH